MQFKYRAVAENGQIIEGLQDAKDEQQLYAHIGG